MWLNSSGFQNCVVYLILIYFNSSSAKKVILTIFFLQGSNIPASERMRNALYAVGTPILQSASSTILGQLTSLKLINGKLRLLRQISTCVSAILVWRAGKFELKLFITFVEGLQKSRHLTYTKTRVVGETLCGR